jgi:ABC-type anion transport system duplicated permease subunit
MASVFGVQALMVALLNRLLWKRLHAFAEDRVRLD